MNHQTRQLIENIKAELRYRRLARLESKARNHWDARPRNSTICLRYYRIRDEAFVARFDWETLTKNSKKKEGVAC